MEHEYLTAEQRRTLRELFDNASPVELLYAVAGIIRNDVADFAVADDAATHIHQAIYLLKGKGKQCKTNGNGS